MKPYEAITFNDKAPSGEPAFKAVVAGRLQRPDFACRGAALAFAQAVHEGKRKPEPIKSEVA